MLLQHVGEDLQGEALLLAALLAPLLGLHFGVGQVGVVVLVVCQGEQQVETSLAAALCSYWQQILNIKDSIKEVFSVATSAAGNGALLHSDSD